jgi:hypothetical protein
MSSASLLQRYAAVQAEVEKYIQDGKPELALIAYRIECRLTPLVERYEQRRMLAQLRNHWVKRSPGHNGKYHLELTDNPFFLPHFSMNRGKTHCKRGHALSGDNLRVYPDGRRCCRECERIMAFIRKHRD